MKPTIIQLLALTLCVSAALAQKPEDISRDFVKLHIENKHSEAIDGYFKDNPFSDRMKDDLDHIKTELASLADGKFGRCISSKLVTDTEISEILREQVYILCYERNPVRFRFIFYRPESTWIAHGFSFDAELDDDLERKSDRLLIATEKN